MSEAKQQAQLTTQEVVAYRAGDLIIDTGRQLVTRGDQEIPLPRLSFDLLLALLRAAPNLVPLDGLMQQVWPNLVVSPETVSQRVKLLRDALEDDPRDPRYIAGLRGRGYRMLVPVARLASPTLQAPAPSETETPAKLRTSRRWMIALGALVLLVAAVPLIWLATSNRARETSQLPLPVVPIVLHERTVAVLPFKNLSREAADEFVALGIAESVLHRLSGIHDLTLIGRTSSFSFRDDRTDAREIGSRLNARYLVEGSVQRAGDRLRVTAQLVDAATGAHVWSLRFDRTLDDIFAVEDEISQSVARELEVSLSRNAHPYARFGTDAYLELLQGRALVARRTVADAERAVARLAHAIEIAPTFAAAHVALADAHILLAQLTGPDDVSPLAAVGYRRAEPLLARALQLDDSLGEAYVLRADLKDYAGDVAGAEKDFRKGLALSPSYGTGYLRFAEYLDKHGRIDEALVAIERARVLDPLTPRHHYYKGMLLNFTGSIQGAEALYLETLRVAPDFHPALIRLANIRRIHQGRFAEAVKLAEQAIAIDPRAQWIRPHLVNFYLELEEIAAARSYLAAQGNPEEPTPWLPICLYERELQRGVDLVRASRDAGAQGDLSDVEGYLIRDAALASGRLADGREELRKTPANANDFEAALDVFRMATLAQVSLALGDQREAETLARRVLNAESRRTPYATAHPKAVALAVLGEKDAAIEKLEQNFDRGLRRNWWYALEREPAFEAFRSDPRFRDLSRRAREHAAAQRRLLEQMRARGEVPVRAPGTTGKPPLC